MVRQILVKKRDEYDVESKHLTQEFRDFLNLDNDIEVVVINRYFVEGLEGERFEKSVKCVFSDPPVDEVIDKLPECDYSIAVELLPAQFDVRANSAIECINLLFSDLKVKVRCAKIYCIKGEINSEQVQIISDYLINPVEAKESGFDVPLTLDVVYKQPQPPEILFGFNNLGELKLKTMLKDLELTLSIDDLICCQQYFKSVGRDPTITEIRVIDTYWSDHCRHTTFNTELNNIKIEDKVVKLAFEKYLSIKNGLGEKTAPVTLMDIATLASKHLLKNSIINNVDESQENNACTVKVKVDVDGKYEDWLLYFKNETHNHPTEIEPYGGAATCIGGAIRDPLSGRAYVYQAMRLSGCADPTTPLDKTLSGKLPQRKIAKEAALGYSSYGNQIGLATGLVQELYHPKYIAKHLEVGAVVGAAPKSSVVRKTPSAGDAVLLIGGETGKDGIGGATGSSKSHTKDSIDESTSEVQKGNPVVERKLQRLFRRQEVCKMIKRCNDFGAGGVSVAVGELADGLLIDLDKIPTKYEGMDATELAISESQERMAVVVDSGDVEKFIKFANEENLSVNKIADVIQDPSLKMTWHGKQVVCISRAFLDMNGAKRSQNALVKDMSKKQLRKIVCKNKNSLEKNLLSLVNDINVASKKGLVNMFDSTIGANCVVFPFGGETQSTEAQSMVCLFPTLKKTNTVSAMSYGFNPYISDANPHVGAYLSVVESITKLVASGFETSKMYLTFQEYFEKLKDDPKRWGKPLSSLLGAFCAQIDLGVGSIGGKDSMSGSFEDMDVVPTLISFAVATGNVNQVITNELKGSNSHILMLSAKNTFSKENENTTASFFCESKSLLSLFDCVSKLNKENKIISSQAVGSSGVIGSLFNMCVGNEIGIKFNESFCDFSKLFSYAYGSIILEVNDLKTLKYLNNCTNFDVADIGKTQKKFNFTFSNEDVDLHNIKQAWRSRLDAVYPCITKSKTFKPITHHSTPYIKKAKNACKPKVIIPTFPGTNCEFDSYVAFQQAGANPKIFLIKNRTSDEIKQSVDDLAHEISNSQILMIPGGFSGGDEPDGSAKFISSFFRTKSISEEISKLIQDRDGLILGICNGFQALLKLGLLPGGEIKDLSEDDPTLTFNSIGTHQSMFVNTRVCSVVSPWMSKMKVGDIHKIPVSHGEGRFVCSDTMLNSLIKNGQVASQYVNEAGMCDTSWDVNPNGSVANIEAICSEDGRILGKMAHSERRGKNLYKNVPGNKFQKLFEGGVDYFSI